MYYWDSLRASTVPSWTQIETQGISEPSKSFLEAYRGFLSKFLNIIAFLGLTKFKSLNQFQFGFKMSKTDFF